MSPIRDYLEKGKLLEDPVDTRTLMEKIGNYTIEDGVLYRKSYLVPLMRCVGPLQANYVIRGVHMGLCGMHDGPRQVVDKAMDLGYFWPSMHRDVRELIKQRKLIWEFYKEICSNGEARSGLVYAARRLRRYFQAHPIKVITDSPIGQVLNNLEASVRLAKWAIELRAYGITYVPRVAIKGHVLADTPTEIVYNRLVDGHHSIAPDDVEYSYVLRLNFSNSNNDAEYEALLAGLQIAKEMQVRDIYAFVDSKLVASQMEGSYEAKGERMIKYREKVLELAGAFNRFRITHIPRAENRKVDALSKLATVQFDHLSKEVLVEVLNERSIEAQEVNVVVEEEGPTWMTPIRDYLEIHGIRADMISVTSAWPFMKCGMDIVGPLPKGPGRVKYLIVAIDYFTKWMEAKPLATITGKQVVNFAYDNIVCKFGIPATIVIDNGTQFVNDPFKKWAEKLMIKLICTSVYHPQGNGAIERENKGLLRGIKTRLEK
ncbi:reverse transcriptase domain-containing protein [Tanacetum coccineum]